MATKHLTIEAFGIDVTALANLVNKEGDEFDSITGLEANQHTELATILRERIADEKKIKVQNAASEILKALQVADQSIVRAVEEVREHRRAEKKVLERMKNIGQCRDYGQETMNFLPLISALKGDTEFTIPVGWKPKKPTVTKKV